MNCLIENEYIKGGKTEKATVVFTNELPNWKRREKTEKKNGKTTLVFTDELPNWKRIHTGKKTEKKTEKKL